MPIDTSAPFEDKDRWSELAHLALQGLRATYGLDKGRLPYTMIWDGCKARPVGLSVRYAIISLLGLGQRQRLSLDGDDLICDLWDRVKVNRDSIKNSAGDLGLALWAQAFSRSREVVSPSQALQTFRGHRGTLDSVELAWVMLGADHALLNDADIAAEVLVQEAREDLLELYNRESVFFYRHARKGPVAGVTRRVPCFANQIYPVMALAVHARRTGCEEAARMGRAVADNLCRFQGPLGQWWWLYDARDGAVVDGYPVFSVHQDGMAPMALVETTRAGGRSYQREIERSLSWIFGRNELEANLLLADQGLVLRDIHKRDVGRLRRAMYSAAWCWGLGRKKDRVQELGGLTVNPECRPYHLGWILYAATLMTAGVEKKATHEQSMEGCGQHG